MRAAAGDVEIAASRRDRCATMGSIGSEATGAWLRRHAIAEDMGRTSRSRGDSSPMSFAPRTFTTGMLSVPHEENQMRARDHDEGPSAGSARLDGFFHGSPAARASRRGGSPVTSSFQSLKTTKAQA